MQEFDLEIRDKKGTENLVADHLSRLEEDYLEDEGQINETFPDEQLLAIQTAPGLLIMQIIWSRKFYLLTCLINKEGNSFLI